MRKESEKNILGKEKNVMKNEMSHKDKLNGLNELLINLVSYSFCTYFEEDCLSYFRYDPVRIVVHYLTLPSLKGNQLLAFVELIEYLKIYFPKMLPYCYDEASSIIAKENCDNPKWYDNMNEYAQRYLKELVEEKM